MWIGCLSNEWSVEQSFCFAMQGPHQVVALLSGGKDSCYAMMCVTAQGHRVVALANLLPLTDETLDTDSHCFQTAGHNVLELFSRVMDLPMYRRRLHGHAVHAGLEYRAAVSGDEVEDLYRLLASVKRAQPSVSAVCSGAILSTYQRLRVEHVCARLGLVSLAPLWQREQSALLRDMIDAQLDAVLIKVACIGLARNHLGRSLSAMRPLLEQLAAQYGVSVCGEGGEFESLCVDCPLFSHAIVIERSATHNLGSGAALLQVLGTALRCKAEPKHEAPAARVVWCDDSDVLPVVVDANVAAAAADAPGALECVAESTMRQGALVHVRVASESMRALCAAMARSCRENNAVPLMVTVCCADMAQFGAFNAVYAAHMGEFPFAPARAVFQGDDPSTWVAQVVAMDAAAAANSVTSLHVQSLSSWAPACIGPYSQLVAGGALAPVWLSGMIPLDPSTMRLRQDLSLPEQLTLCVAHCAAVLLSMGYGRSTIAVATVLVCDHAHVELARAALGRELPHALGVVEVVVALPRGAAVELVCVAFPQSHTLEDRGAWRVARSTAGDCPVMFGVEAPGSAEPTPQRVLYRRGSVLCWLE